MRRNFGERRKRGMEDELEHAGVCVCARVWFEEGEEERKSAMKAEC